jgi:hypothetical protein
VAENDNELEGSESGAQGETTYIDAVAAGDRITIPDGDALLHGEYSRAGPDLVITGEDGSRIVVTEFFSAGSPDLISEGGARIQGDLAGKLAGPMAPGQFAQALPAMGAEPVGTVDNIEGEGVIIRADGTSVTLAEGVPIFQGVSDVSAFGTD